MKRYSHPELVEIARRQRQVLLLFLASIPVVLIGFVPVSEPAGEVLAFPLLAAFLTIGFAGTVFLYRLAKAIKDPVPWLYVVCSWIPYVNTLVLLILMGRASIALKENGVRVGLLGATEVPEPRSVHTATNYTADRA